MSFGQADAREIRQEIFSSIMQGQWLVDLVSGYGREKSSCFVTASA